MDIETLPKNNALLVKVRGRMDALMAVEFDHAFDKLMQAGDKNYVLDLSGLEYVSSAGLRSLLSVHKKIRGLNGKLLLCGLSGVVKEVFDISGFASIFQIFDTPESALAKLP